jgi:hypothetical protein
VRTGGIAVGGGTEGIAATGASVKTVGKTVATTGTVIALRLKEGTASQRRFSDVDNERMLILLR